MATQKKTTLLSDALNQVGDGERADMMAKLRKEFDARRVFEKAKAPGNSTIQKNLTTYEKKLIVPGIAGMMIATHVPAEVINRELTSGKRFNIYALDKMADLLHAANSGQMRNAINIAIMKSLFKAQKAGVAFTGLMAQAACSDKVKVDKAMQAILIRHTASAATAPTQCSSTMNALVAIGAVANKGTQKYPTWALTDAPITHRLQEVLAA